MKKRIFAILLVLVMLLVPVLSGCSKTEKPADKETPVESKDDEKKDESKDESKPKEDEKPAGNLPVDDMDTMTVGVPEMNGDFVTGFGNSSYDRYIRVLIGGFNGTYEVSSAGQFVLNETVVKKLDVSTDDAKNKTYTFTIHEDLKFNNGDPIMAKDFVAGALFSASPEWLKAGANSDAFDSLLGYAEYHKGHKIDDKGLAVDADGNTIEVITEVEEEGKKVKKSNLEEIKDKIVPVKNFPGIKLLGDYQFSLTIDAKKLPYFFEPSYVSAGPTHMATYVPGAEIVSDDEKGASFNEGYDLLTAAKNVAEKERFAPTVTAGPYKFVSFENQIVTMVRNDHFKGTWEGKKPQIKNLVQKAVPQTTDVDSLLAGDIDLVTGVIQGEKIEKAKSSDNASTHSYFRSGFGLLAMHCDWGPTADKNVRWAMAQLIDRAKVIDHVLKGYGSTVDSSYGLAQWMYEEREEQLAEKLKPISFNIEEANKHLDNSAYKFEADGTTPFDPKKAKDDASYLRHNENKEPLVIKHLGTTDNPVTDIIEIEYVKNAPMAGIKFEVTKSDFNALLDNYYYGFELGDERQYSSFNLATNFSAVYDPYYSWHSKFLGTWQNSYQLSTEKLDELTVKMRELDPKETDKFADYWVELQVELQDQMPLIPLYSNEYFDISHKNLKGIATTPFADYAATICDFHKSAD